MNRNYNLTIPWAGWKITGELGRGTYGAVFEIEREILGTTEKSAMKVVYIPSDDAMLDSILFSANYDQATAQKSLQKELMRAQQEYVMMNRLKGITNIVSCEDFAYQEREDGVGYIVFIRMELLKSLQKETREKRRRSEFFTRDEVIRIGRDVSRALDVCEQRGLIHRDIKPSNILVSEYGDYKIGDFGTARGLDHTMQATYAGTQSFMAPEVYRREPYGKTVDIYSLGLVMYWLMNRYHMPFVPLDTVPGSEELQIAETRRVQGEQLPPPCDAGSELSQIILKACEPDSTRRYHSASEMYHDLTDLSEGRYTTDRGEVHNFNIESYSSHSRPAVSEPVFVPEPDDTFDDEQPTVAMTVPAEINATYTVPESYYPLDIIINTVTAYIEALDRGDAEPMRVFGDVDTAGTDNNAAVQWIINSFKGKSEYNRIKGAQIYTLAEKLENVYGKLEEALELYRIASAAGCREASAKSLRLAMTVQNSSSKAGGVKPDKSVNKIIKAEELKTLLSVYAVCRNKNPAHVKKVTGKIFREVIRSGLIPVYTSESPGLEKNPELITDMPDPLGWVHNTDIKGYYMVDSAGMDQLLKALFHLDMYLYRDPDDGVFYRYGDKTYVFERVSDDTVYPKINITHYSSGLLSSEVTFAAVYGHENYQVFKAKITMRNNNWGILSCSDV